MSNSTHKRHTTENFKRAFAFVEAKKDEDEKTITKYLNTKCSICFDIITKMENIAVLSTCGHHSCKTCIYDYLTHIPKQICCFTCRLEFDRNMTISTIDWGICNIDEYLSKYEIMNYEDFDDGLSIRQNTCCNPISLTRQITGIISRNVTQDVRHILPPIPRDVKHFSNILNNDSSSNNDIYFYRTPLIEIIDQYGIKKYIGTSVMISPYQDLKEQPLIDVVIILDRSGSMDGYMLDNAKKSIEELIEKSRNKDSIRISLIIFDHCAEHVFPLQTITDQNFDSIIDKVRSIYSRGSTDYDCAFEMLKDVIPVDNQIQICVFFLTDGIPDRMPNLSFLEEYIYRPYPTIIFHIVSIGNNVEAENNLLPLHCGRDCDELAKYSHLSESTNATFFYEHIGDTIGIYAEHICFSFGSGIKPIYSRQLINEDGSSTIDMSILSKNSTVQIAFMIDDNTSYDDNTNISVSYDINGNTLSKIAILDKDNITGNTMKNFAVFRYYTLEVNMIIDSKKNIEIKKKLLNNILSITTPELFGNFYEDFKSNLKIRIKNLDITTVEYRNLIAQSQVRENSMGRQTSENLSKCVSSYYNDDDELEECV